MVVLVIINLGISSLRAVRGEAWMGKQSQQRQATMIGSDKTFFLELKRGGDFFEAFVQEGGWGFSSLGHQIYLS